jgi:hypothetical protein
LQAILTEFWNEDLPEAIDAQRLAADLKNSTSDFNDTLRAATSNSGQRLHIMGLDTLFRRQSLGFSAIKSLVSALSVFEHQSGNDSETLICGCNALVYAFLVGAKNFDFILPEHNDHSVSSFRCSLPAWTSTIEQLENFEREGMSMSDRALQQTYLNIRPVMTRPTARDERRSLCTLLMSGPSTPDEITQDLGLPYTLSERVLSPFIESGIVESTGSDEQYVITRANIPLVVYLVRETLGVDPLKMLRD